MTLNKSKLRKEFSAEYVMTEKAKETLQWIEEHCEGWMEEKQPEPVQEVKSEEEWRTKLLDYLHKFYTRFEEWSNDYTDKDSFLQMIDSFIKNNPLHEYRSQAIRLPEIQFFIHANTNESVKECIQVKNIYDNIISELKRLNNI